MKQNPVIPRAVILTIVSCVALSACASSRVTLAPGENGQVAVLDPKSEAEVSVFDKPGATANVTGAKAGKTTVIDQATFDQRHGQVMTALPRTPRAFTLYFKENSTDPTAESEAAMPSIFDEIKSRDGADIQVTGHTDTVGSMPVNDAFSLRRAAEITSFLFTLGLDKAIVRLAGRGERELKEETADEVPSAINRRVEVIVR
jgi:outer membrane protein OmpA-like peptidoglycan-associated protein